MEEPQILSTFDPPAAAATPGRMAPGLRVVDTCQLGVVLRAVLLVEAALAVATMFVAETPMDWLTRVAWVTAGALPATLAWLLSACVMKPWLARRGLVGQQLIMILLGAVGGLLGCALLQGTGLLQPAPWWSSAFSGALLSALLVSVLVLRAQGRAPADAKAHLAELQARIRPHFLFNTLNSAIALVRAEPQRAERLLEDLSDLFRYALSEPGDSVALADEIELAQRYLAIEQVRFGARMQVLWELDPRASPARLPPLLLQPLVENAVRHGVERSSDAARIRIATQCRGATVVIKVSNSVPAQAVQAQAGHGLALDNVRQRLRLLHDVQGRFQSGLKGGEFQVRIEVPL